MNMLRKGIRIGFRRGEVKSLSKPQASSTSLLSAVPSWVLLFSLPLSSFALSFAAVFLAVADALRE